MFPDDEIVDGVRCDDELVGGTQSDRGPELAKAKRDGAAIVNVARVPKNRHDEGPKAVHMTE